jgi:prophage regulatory protein
MGERFIRIKEVRARISLSRSSIYTRVQAGQFPRPINIGVRAVAWRESEIIEWMNARIAEGTKRGGTA